MAEATRAPDGVIIGLVREQTKTNTQILERLDKSYEKLASIDAGFRDVVDKYHAFSNKMDRMVNTFSNFKGYFIVFGSIGVAIGVAIVIALLRMAP
ncbi:MAG: hypothetical protein KAW84_04670 [Thermoplasmata archaeon]|nr:hypothetical protein [Thermoplasmata archaeon]